MYRTVARNGGGIPLSIVCPKQYEGGRKKKSPLCGATSDLIMQRACCADRIGLCVLRGVLIGESRSDRQYKRNLQKKK